MAGSLIASASFTSGLSSEFPTLKPPARNFFIRQTSLSSESLSGSSPPPPSPPPGASLLSLSLSSCEQSALMMVKAVGVDHCSLSHFPHFRCHSPHLHHRAHHLRHQVDCLCWGPMGLSVRIPIKHGTP